MKHFVLALACSAIAAVAFAQTPAPDTVYLLERVSVTTSSGVFGFPPGTRLQVLARRGDTLNVKTSDSQFDVRADQVTPDAQAARALNQQDAAQQAAIQQRAAENAARVREANMRQQQPAAEKSAAGKPTRDPRLIELQKKETLLKLQLERLHEDWRDLQQHNSKTSPNAYALKQQIRAAERELLDVRQQQVLVRMQSQ